MVQGMMEARKRARGDREEWIYGIAPVSEAIARGARRVLELRMAPLARNKRLNAIRGMARDLPVRETDWRELDRLSQGGVHQGVMARVEPYPWCALEALLEGEGPLLMLEGVQDPRNLGAIIRSAVVLGASGIVMEKRRSAPLTPRVAKAACGALEHARLCRVPNLPRAIQQLKKAGQWIVGTVDRGGVPLWEAEIPDPATVVLGAEGSGIRPIVRRGCDLWVSIPSEGPMGTMNVSVAAALVLYEIHRRKKRKERECEGI